MREEIPGDPPFEREEMIGVQANVIAAPGHPPIFNVATRNARAGLKGEAWASVYAATLGRVLRSGFR